MISVIICSRTQTISSVLSENIKKTVGCDYELVVIDNSENTYSIFEAYNLGIEKSVNDYLCFIHDDILFHTEGWGTVIQRIFNEEQKIGLLGIAGTKVKTKMPSGWWDCPDELKEISVIQHVENKKVEKWYYGFKNGNISEVVAIDGVFMAMRKDKRIHFSTELKGFHNYDLNISMEYQIKGYKIVVVNSILIEHFSNGTINESWYESSLKTHKLYDKHLPFITNEIQKVFSIKDLEIKNGTTFLNHIYKNGYSNQLVRLWFELFLLNPFSKFHYRFLKKNIKIILKTLRIF